MTRRVSDGDRRRWLTGAAIAAPVLALALAPGASGQSTLGTAPVPISVGPDGEPADGPSGGPAFSGDDRRARIVAFHSEATNLVAGDRNAVPDVFAWFRPRGSAGLRLTRPGGRIERVSVSSAGAEANGASLNPSVDGSLRRAPHCVAFQSQATNLSADDADQAWDVYVRDLRRARTILVSRSTVPDATRPAIDGACRQVAFEAGGRVYLASVGGGRPRSLGTGANPDVSLDGTAVVWERAGAVLIRRRGRTTTVARGHNPRVSDLEGRAWGVVFDTTARLSRRDTSGRPDVYSRRIRATGRAGSTDLVSARRRGGRRLPGASGSGDTTAFGTNRGFLTWVTTGSGRSTFWYRNNNTGNIDDLAVARASGQPSIFDAVTSARGNFVAYVAAAEQGRFDRNGAMQDVFVKHLGRGARL